MDAGSSGSQPEVVKCSRKQNLPYIGQQFDSETLAYESYNGYASSVGFSVRKGYNHKEEGTGRVIDKMYFCQQQGFKRVDKRRCQVKKERANIRCGCEAHMRIALDKVSGKFVVSSFKEGHNHKLHPIDSSHLLRSQRKFSPARAVVAELARMSGISLRQTYEYMGNEVGGIQNLGFTKDDMKRHMQSRKQRTMANGEAVVLLEYFQQQRMMNPAYYSAFSVDSEQRITNIFWADAKMILDYARFGDVVAFDTTYKTNNFHRPCAVFAGFTHFRKTVIFGGALMYDETADSFEWLFKTFMHCMSNKKPKTIFTDQAQAISIGLSRVLPETRHCLCTWHLTQDLRNHYGMLLKDGIVGAWQDCMHGCLSEEEFDEVWQQFLECYGVATDDWFLKKYELRHKWADAYLKNTLTLGMASTQLSERLNASLKDWLNPDKNMLDFFHHFNRVVNIKRHEQTKAEFEGRQKKFCSRVKLSPMLAHASEVYTLPIFEKFEVEYLESQGLVLHTDRVFVGGEMMYKVHRYDEDDNIFEVYARADDQVVGCKCAMFEMCGYLCCHCLKVLDHLNIKTIPEHYILKRWTKAAKAECVLDFSGVETEADTQHIISQRYHALCQNLVKIAAMASENREAYDLVVKVASDLAQKVADICVKKVADPDACRPHAYPVPTSDLSQNSPVTPTDEDSTCNTSIASTTVAIGTRGRKRLLDWYERATGKRRCQVSKVIKGKKKAANATDIVSRQTIGTQNSHEGVVGETDNDKEMVNLEGGMPENFHPSGEYSMLNNSAQSHQVSKVMKGFRTCQIRNLKEGNKQAGNVTTIAESQTICTQNSHEDVVGEKDVDEVVVAIEGGAPDNFHHSGGYTVLLNSCTAQHKPSYSGDVFDVGD